MNVLASSVHRTFRDITPRGMFSRTFKATSRRRPPLVFFLFPLNTTRKFAPFSGHPLSSRLTPSSCLEQPTSLRAPRPRSPWWVSHFSCGFTLNFRLFNFLLPPLVRTTMPIRNSAFIFFLLDSLLTTQRSVFPFLALTINAAKGGDSLSPLSRRVLVSTKRNRAFWFPFSLRKSPAKASVTPGEHGFPFSPFSTGLPCREHAKRSLSFLFLPFFLE